MKTTAMYRLEKTAVLDIETTRDHNTIWMAGIYFPSSGKSMYATSPQELSELLDGVETILGHNVLGFDLPVLKRVWGWSWTNDIHDTYIMSCLGDPNREGGHSLANLAEAAGGELKDDFDDYDGGLTQDMIDYCLQDCRANWDVFLYLVEELRVNKFDLASLYLEYEVKRLTVIQEQNGFYLDFDKACSVYNSHKARMEEIQSQLQERFPPIVTERWSTKTGKRLKDHVEVFNVGSRQQVAKRLSELGAKWTTTTPTGRPVVDEKTLAKNSHIPEAMLVLEYLNLQKKIGMVKSWIDNVGDDDRVHGRVNTCGAITFRMTHSKPNLAQAPSCDPNDPSTWVYRECFSVERGNKLVGIDASGLELRMLAHYMNDSEYTELILNGDIHTYNQNAAGLETRPQAKTFIYAFLYGAGDAKIGSITGGGAKEGAALKEKFLTSLPALERLLSRVHRVAQSGSLPGLDGRRIMVRSEHSALNTLLQSAGAIVMKKALVIGCNRLDAQRIPYKLVAQVHDEFQFEVPEAYATRVGSEMRRAIIDAGVDFNLRCPLDGEYKIGNNWKETH